MKFEMSGRKFEFDFSPEKLMGDEMLLIDDLLPAGYAERWAAEQVGVRDVLVWAYISAKRDGEMAEFGEFIKTVAPATFRKIEGEPTNRAARRAQAKAKTKTAPPAAAEDAAHAPSLAGPSE